MHEPNLAPSGLPLREELDKRLGRARAEGLVHLGGMIDVGNTTTTGDLLQVLNNILRIRETRPEPTFSM